MCFSPAPKYQPIYTTYSWGPRICLWVNTYLIFPKQCELKGFLLGLSELRVFSASAPCCRPSSPVVDVAVVAAVVVFVDFLDDDDARERSADACGGPPKILQGFQEAKWTSKNQWAGPERSVLVFE